MGFFTQSGEADELLEQHLVLLLDKATFDAEAGVGEVLAHVVLHGLLPDAACVEINIGRPTPFDAMLSP